MSDQNNTQQENANHGSNRRHFMNYMLGSRRQLNYSLGFLFCGIMIFVIYAYCFLYFFSHSLAALGEFYGVSSAANYEIQQSLKVAVYMVIMFSFFIIVAIFVVGTTASHRIFGPFVQIIRMLEQIKAGNYKVRIQLRKNDEFQDVAKLLNEIAEKLEKK